MIINLRKFSLILTMVLCASAAKAQVDLTKKVNALLDLVQEYHLKSKPIDEDFVLTMNKSFVAALDPNEIIFSKEDLPLIEAQAQLLVGKCRQNSQQYVDFVHQLWATRLEEAEGIVTDYFKTPIDANKGVESTLFDGHVNASELIKKWSGLLRYQLLSDVFDSSDKVLKGEELKQAIDSAVVQAQSGMNDYFQNSKLTKTEIENVYVNAMAETMDPHSSYFNASEYSSFQEELSRERELFGISYSKNNKGVLSVSEVLPGSSAWLSDDVHTGDQILRIDFGGGNDFSLVGSTALKLGKLFDEYGDQEITLTLKTGNSESRKVVLVKSKVYSDSDVIKSAVLNGSEKVGYISLPDFYTNWDSGDALGCANDIAKTVIKLKKENVEGIILDLRNNGGGSLKEAIDLAGLFVDYGPILVTTNSFEDPSTIKDMNRGLIFSGPLVVMINGYSASASEVVAGALQDYNRALVVGSTSFGKATGQQMYSLAPDDVNPEFTVYEEYGYAKLTNMGLYRISLATNQINGVVPDVELPLANATDFFKEEDYDGAIVLDSIEKKMYFTPKAKLKSEPWRSRSAIRVADDAQVNAFIALRAQSEKLIEAFDPYGADLSEWIAFEEKWNNLSTQSLENKSALTVSFEPASIAYDQEVYDMDAVLKMYNDRFLTRLKSDLDLSETYEITLEMINQ